MGFDWSQATIGQFVELQRGNTYRSELLDQPGPVLLGLASIEREGGFRSDKLRTYGGDSPPKLLVFPGDIYVSLKDVTQSGDLLGSVARVPETVAVGRMTQDTVKLIFKNDLIDRAYLYWVLRSPEYREYCRSRSMGTTNLSMSRDDFLSFPVPEPSDARLLLVKMLDNVEAKISLNRRINQTLEAMAQAIFKSWFVDFDPVKAKIAAKAEGRDPLRAAMSAISGKTDAELDALAPEQHAQLAATAALFPDEMVESELGEIPKGWQVGRLDDLLVLQRGFDLPNQDRIPGAVQIIAASGPSGFHNEAAARGPGVVTGRSGVLGRVFLTLDDYWPLNTTLWVKEFRVATPCYAFELLRGIDFCAFNAGSAVPTLNRNHIHGLPCLMPSVEVISKFEGLAVGFHKLVKENAGQSDALIALRDALLPKLLSGELAITSKETEAIA